MSNLSERFAWFEFDIGTFLNHHATGTLTNRCSHTHIHAENASLWGVYHMAVGTGALWDACLFSAVNRSHEATGA